MIHIPFIYNLRSMKARWISALVAVMSIAGVVAVFLAMLSMARGFRETIKSAGSDDNALVLRGGATSEVMSSLHLEHTKIIGDAAGVKRDKKGNPIISKEVVTNIYLARRDTKIKYNVKIRGLTPKALEVHDKITLTKGRFFKPGLAELVVGKNLAPAYQGLDMGESISFGGQTWQVVGLFESGGSSFDSEIWCDATLLCQAFKRPTDIFGAVTAKLSSTDTFSQFKDALTSDPRLNIKVERESTFYEKQSKGLATFIRALGFVVAFVMAIGAVFAALNTMYASVSERSSEIATLRALGFVEGNVVTSFLLESLTISFFGGIVGCVLVLPLNGFTASTFNMATYSQLAFAFRVTPDLMIQGIIFALFMGFFGGLFPALRAALQPIAGTLRGM